MDKLEKHAHYANGKLRGAKADLYEGGHRVPTLAVWPKVIPAGSETERLTSLSDFYATCAEISGHQMASHEGVDSVSFLPTLKDPAVVERDAIVMHSFYGHFAIRQGDWKLICHGGSGGWSAPAVAPEEGPIWQLYNMREDLSETNNLYAAHPEKVEALHQLLMQYINDGRSTAGEKQKNAVPIILEKGDEAAKERLKRKGGK